MRITAQQQGPIAQNEVAKLGMLGTDGETEFDLAVTDDDGRDFEVHRRRHFGVSLSLQVKSVLKLRRDHRIRKLRTQVQIPVAQLGAHRPYWFFFAYLDPRAMAFASPCFLVPSSALYQGAPRGRRGRLITFEFDASMAAVTRDKWSGYRVAPEQLGNRLLAILARLESKTGPAVELADSQQTVTPKSEYSSRKLVVRSRRIFRRRFRRRKICQQSLR